MLGGSREKDSGRRAAGRKKEVSGGRATEAKRHQGIRTGWKEGSYRLRMIGGVVKGPLSSINIT